MGEVDRVGAPSDDCGDLFADASHIPRAEAQPFEAAGEGVGNIPSSTHFNRHELYRPVSRSDGRTEGGIACLLPKLCGGDSLFGWAGQFNHDQRFSLS